MGKSRINMSCKLEAQQVSSNSQLKQITQHDVTKVATTMLEAYEGTVDQQEETLEQAILEVEKIIKNRCGAFISEASFWIEMNDEAAAVICINLWNGTPLITEILYREKISSSGNGKFVS